ncbi:GNAT family N-acetyltransferase [Actinophytocola oryzae]|uniref:Acetyltransferase (GNAT) family protein n=1 Tax=Actinophytocola oryzae TaxID=502181 RepID=A0A4R7VZF1_9PSEU|nr:GNAT family N-acetyltransferase [Actinophytocola oryzae]TDV55048.1 acetyltransferase (GNAT) family protein [Actinophytocola oryzae]
MIRVVQADDAEELSRMMARCSPMTRYDRFHGVVTEIPPAYLRCCLSGEHTALVAEADGEIVGLASVGPVFEEPDMPEVAVIVEDAWQGRGVGRELVAAVLAKAGVATVRMEVCRTSLLTYLTGTLPVVARRRYGRDVTIDVDVRSVVQ